MLVGLIVLALMAATVIWLVQNGRSRIDPGHRGRLGAGPAGMAADTGDTDDWQAPATVPYGPEPGAGVLRLTATQLVFTAAGGRVSVIERDDIRGVTTTVDLPDRTVARPVVAVVTAAGVSYFAVAQPEQWRRRIAGG